MDRKPLPDATFNELCVLRAVMDLTPSPYGGSDPPQAYGWAIWKYISDNGGRVVVPSMAAIYGILAKLVERGVIARSGLVESDRGPARVTYRLTEEGDRYWHEVFAMTDWLSGR